jgi:hypothetical protein
VFCCLVSLSQPLRAQAYGEPVGLLLEPTYALPFPVFLQGGQSPVSNTKTVVPYTLEASIALQVPLTSSLVELEQRDGWAHAFVFIPRVDLRHGLGTSFPIRTPGFYPTVRFQFFHQVTHAAWLRQRWIGEFFIAHQSNGQDGCFYRGQDATDACRFPDGEQHVGAPLNHKNGSFANNELGLRAGLERRRGLPRSALTTSALFGLVLFRPEAGGIDPESEALYGWLRAELWLRTAKRLFAGTRGASELGARLKVDARLGHKSVENPVGMLLDAFWRFDVLRDWGPFVRNYWGGDYYNIRFDARVWVLGVGLMWEA